MRFGIISDIHANLEALQTALGVLEKEGVEQIICLGDVVGYGASPKECLDIMCKNNIPTIRGNHERYVLGEFNEAVKDDTMKVIEWTRDAVGADLLKFMESMPNKMLHESGFLITHGSPRNKDEYLIKLNSFIASLKFMEEKHPAIKICFHGHTHVPSVWARGHIVQNISEDKTVELDPEKTYLINPGSVGQPRDKCPLASFGILDSDAYTFQFFRREYDVEEAQRKIHEHLGFAGRFADRLSIGA